MSGQTSIVVLPHLAFASRLSVGIIFLLSVLPKLHRPLTFTRSVIAYNVLPNGAASLFALALIPTEAFLAIAFLTGWHADIALPLAVLLLLSFLIAISINLRRGRRISCGCFGSASERISLRTVARLLLLLTVVLLLLACRAGGMSWPSVSTMSADTSAILYLLQTVLLAAFLILMAVWLLNLPDLVALVPRSHGNLPSSESTRVRDGREDR